MNVNFTHLPSAARKAAEGCGIAWPCFNPYAGIIARAIELAMSCEESLQIVEVYKEAKSVSSQPVRRRGRRPHSAQSRLLLRSLRGSASGAFQCVAKATVPSTKMFGGDFSELSTPIYDPATFDATTGQRRQFPGNVIPSDRINSMAAKLLPFYVAAPSYGNQNLIGNPVTTDNYDQYGFRTDSTINSKNSVYGQFVRENSPTVNAALFPLAGYGFPLTTDFAMAQWTSTLTPHLVNEFRLGFLYTEVPGSNQIRMVYFMYSRAETSDVLG